MKRWMVAAVALAALSCASVYAEEGAIFSISAADVTEAKVIFRKNTATTLELILTADKARELAYTTEINTGKTIQIQIQGETVAAPLVKEKIAGSNLQITTKDEEQALRVARRLTTPE